MNKRIASIDIVRGIVMIIMALDHTRDFLHTTAITQSPTNLETTTPALFFTRWVTHLCAPTFVFLSGASVYLSFQNNRNIKSLGAFLRKRGLWLILLEFTIINFLLWFDLQFRILMMQVIAAIGFGFIILSLLLKFSTRTIGFTGLSIIVLHNLLQFVPFPTQPALQFVANLLYAPGLLPVTPNFGLLISYPIIPWTGIMLLGYGMGKYFLNSNQSFWLKAGLGSLAVFILLRFINIYGDPAPWSVQKDNIFSFISFMNVTKYPPSLQFVSLFLGIAFLLIFLSQYFNEKISNIFKVYGSVPMFYYLLHFTLIRVSLFIMVFVQGFSWSQLGFGPFQLGRPPKEPSGIELEWVYAAWILIVVLLYPLCKWYSRYKASHPEKTWLRYL